MLLQGQGDSVIHVGRTIPDGQVVEEFGGEIIDRNGGGQCAREVGRRKYPLAIAGSPDRNSEYMDEAEVM